MSVHVNEETGEVIQSDSTERPIRALVADRAAAIKALEEGDSLDPQDDEIEEEGDEIKAATRKPKEPKDKRAAFVPDDEEETEEEETEPNGKTGEGGKSVDKTKAKSDDEEEKPRKTHPKDWVRLRHEKRELERREESLAFREHELENSKTLVIEQLRELDSLRGAFKALKENPAKFLSENGFDISQVTLQHYQSRDPNAQLTQALQAMAKLQERLDNYENGAKQQQEQQQHEASVSELVQEFRGGMARYAEDYEAAEFIANAQPKKFDFVLKQLINEERKRLGPTHVPKGERLMQKLEGIFREEYEGIVQAYGSKPKGKQPVESAQGARGQTAANPEKKKKSGNGTTVPTNHAASRSVVTTGPKTMAQRRADAARELASAPMNDD